MATNDQSTLELFGALTTSLARAIALLPPSELNRLEAETLELMETVRTDSASAAAFRTVLLEIKARRAFNVRQ